jgi:predicted Fe-S protein YdhL (DUF1289 family)
MLPPSPCIGICRIDESSRLCIGCARTAEEIAIWRSAPARVVERIWAELPARRRKLGIGLHRLDWTADVIRDFVAATLENRRGTWVFGVHGAVAEFCIGKNEPMELLSGDHAIIASTGRGAVRFEISDSVRALAVGGDPRSGGNPLIILAVPVGMAQLPRHEALARLGPDPAAVQQSSHNDVLYDLGLGTSMAQFCIRTADQPLRKILDRYLGSSWPVFLPIIGASLLAAAPPRVVITATGRVEVLTPILQKIGMTRPGGPHTHFLPDLIATGHRNPPALNIPQAYCVGAVFYPENPLE